MSYERQFFDDLEAGGALVCREGRAPEVRRALGALDEAAEREHSMWSLLPSLAADARLSDVAWQEPDAWWGALAMVRPC